METQLDVLHRNLEGFMAGFKNVCRLGGGVA